MMSLMCLRWSRATGLSPCWLRNGSMMMRHSRCVLGLSRWKSVRYQDTIKALSEPGMVRSVAPMLLVCPFTSSSAAAYCRMKQSDHGIAVREVEKPRSRKRRLRLPCRSDAHEQRLRRQLLFRSIDQDLVRRIGVGAWLLAELQHDTIPVNLSALDALASLGGLFEGASECRLARLARSNLSYSSGTLLPHKCEPFAVCPQAFRTITLIATEPGESSLGQALESRRIFL